MLVGFAHSFTVLLLLRLMLGLGESAGFPCASKILASVVPPKGLGLANGIVAFAYLFGPAVGLYAGGLLDGAVRLALGVLCFRRAVAALALAVVARCPPRARARGRQR